MPGRDGWGASSARQADLSLAARHKARHTRDMANRNVFAIAGIGLFLLVGAVVVIAVAGTILMVVYGFVVIAFKNIFGIELPHIF